MFFILSKLLAFVLSPLLWGVFLLVLAVLTKKTIRKKRRFMAAIIVLLFFSNMFVYDQTARIIELDSQPLENLKTDYKYGIVLGTIAGFDSQKQRVVFYETADRLNQTVWLYKKGCVEKILISGGQGKLFGDTGTVEADFLAQYLIDTGISSSDLITENKSRNTHQNALFTAELLQKKGEIEERHLLITSGTHIFRAKKCFEKEGIQVDVYPTNINSSNKLTVSDYIVPDAKTLYEWNGLLHEFAGLAAYKIMGYI